MITFILLLIGGIFLLPNSLYRRFQILKPTFLTIIGLVLIAAGVLSTAMSYAEPGKIYKVYYL